MASEEPPERPGAAATVILGDSATAPLEPPGLAPTVILGDAEPAPTVILDAGAPPPEPAASAGPPAPAASTATRLDWGEAGRPLGGRYVLDRKIGSGGMGTVYLADDLLLQRKVAVKTLWSEAAFDDADVARFRREVAMAHVVSHPNVARTYDLGATGGVNYLTMEYLEGETLEARLARRPLPTAAEIRALAVPICRGLQAAHRAGIVHRDLKPANIMLVGGARQAVIMDFGIAGLAAEARDAAAAAAPRERRGAARDPGVTSAGFGTPAFMAPERWRGAPGDPRSDIYALGVILHLCLTGEAPYAADTAEELARLHREAPVPEARAGAARTDHGLARLVRRCLAKRPADRPQSVDEILEGLEMPARWRRFAGQLAGMGAAATLLLAGFGWAVTATAERTVLDEMRPALQAIAELVARDLDPADLDALRRPADAGSDAFRRVGAAISARVRELPDARNVYVMRRGDAPGHYVYVFDPQPEDRDLDGDGVVEAATGETGSPPGSTYDGSAFPWMARVLDSGRPAAESEFSLDEGSYILSGFATVATTAPDGPYLVGVDATNQRLTALARRVRLALGAVWVAVLGVLVGVFHPRRQLRRQHLS